MPSTCPVVSTESRVIGAMGWSSNMARGYVRQLRAWALLAVQCDLSYRWIAAWLRENSSGVPYPQEVLDTRLLSHERFQPARVRYGPNEGNQDQEVRRGRQSGVDWRASLPRSTEEPALTVSLGNVMSGHSGPEDW